MSVRPHSPAVRAALVALLCFAHAPAAAQEPTRLLRQPTLSDSHIAFTYGADLWTVPRSGGVATRVTSTPAVESDPHFSPDGRWIAFSSNRSGSTAVYVVPTEGGAPTRLTWYPAAAFARGWTRDGSRVLYSSGRGTAPTSYERLWTVTATGGPSELVPAPWGFDGDYAPDGRRMIVDRMSRWDVEWRSYRGGQNTPLVILDVGDLSEVRLPNEERTTDIQPLWMGDKIYFLSDRDWAMNVWSYDPATEALARLTRFDDAEAKWLSGRDGTLALEQDGYIHLLDAESGALSRVDITVRGDFPWAETRWEDVTPRATNASLSPTGQRVLVEARGEVFTAPVENGDSRNLTRSSGVADRLPVWSPDGGHIAWFSDDGSGYELVIADQMGADEPRRIDIGESVMAWDASWSPDGRSIAFVDDDVRVRVVDVESGTIRTADAGGSNLERGAMSLVWSPDSKWLAYSKTFSNMFSRIVAWSAETGVATALTDPMAHALAPAWDRAGRYLYFVASTNYALSSGWANTSSIGESTTFTPYLMVLRADDETPFLPQSDEEEVTEGNGGDESARGGAGSADEGGRDEGDGDESGDDADDDDDDSVRIDFDGIERRILALPMPAAGYRATYAGPAGTVFIANGATLHKFSVDDREASVFTEGVFSVAISADAQKMLFRRGSNWHVVGTERAPEGNAGRVELALRTQLDRHAEWRQMFAEAWHYERDFFYDPGMHGNDWNAVRRRYEPLVPWVQHRSDLNYVLDQVNGELSVGHSFVFGGDLPAVDTVRVGLLGADLEPDEGRWRISRIYTFESWNPNLAAPLDRAGMRVGEGTYLVGVDGIELTAADDPYRLFDGTAGRQTVLHLNDAPTFEGSWTETVEPIRSEAGLRQRGWVEDNRRRVDELSGGRLGYAWIPNTGGPGTTSFDRYVFAQQDKEGLVIDERFNGGGNLDDYMVDYMTRSLRASITNEVPNGEPIRLPQGILGPKALLINELAGSGGDYFPWAFRQQNVGPLIGARTWGGLVKSSVHYSLIDGGALTAPDNAVFDPVDNVWVAENEGVPPDIEVLIDAASVAEGRDVQLERAVEEVLRLLAEQPTPGVRPPPFPTPSRRPGGGGE